MSQHSTVTDLDDGAVQELDRCEIGGDCPERWTMIVVGRWESRRWFYRVCDPHHAYLWAGRERQADWTLTHRPRAMFERIEAERSNEALATIRATLDPAEYVAFLREELDCAQAEFNEADGRHRDRWQRRVDFYEQELLRLGETA